MENLNNQNKKLVNKNNKNRLNKSIVPSDIELQVVKTKDKIKFKVYEEDELDWPINSFLIQNSHKIRPKNGDMKRISHE